jgi:hypothetical protein
MVYVVEVDTSATTFPKFENKGTESYITGVCARMCPVQQTQYAS